MSWHLGVDVDIALMVDLRGFSKQHCIADLCSMEKGGC